MSDSLTVKIERLSAQTTIVQAASGILAAVYLCGFVVLNAYLGKRGVFDFDLASMRYLIAGTLFAVFLVVWYLFPGRAVFFGTKWLKQEIDAIHMQGLASSWAAVVYLNFFGAP